MVEVSTGAAEISRSSTAARLLLWVAKTAALWLTLIGTSEAAWQIGLHMGQAAIRSDDGLLNSIQALLAANLAIALALALLASRARVAGWRLAVLLGVALYGLQSFMMIIDGIWFNNTLGLSMSAWLALGVHDAIVAAVVGLVGSLVFHPAAETARAVPARIFWRIVALMTVYVFLYFGAGTWAWQHDVLRHYYAHMQISFGPTVALQFARGFLWAVIALFVACRIKGSLMSRVFVMAVLFGVLTAMQLLGPNPVMPWAIRQIHMVEIGVSEILYGAIAPLVLLAGAARRPLSNTSRWRLITGAA